MKANSNNEGHFQGHWHAGCPKPKNRPQTATAREREREQRLVNPATSPVIVVVKLESQPDIRSIFFLFSAVIIDCKTDFDSSLNSTKLQLARLCPLVRRDKLISLMKRGKRWIGITFGSPIARRSRCCSSQSWARHANRTKIEAKGVS